MLMNCSRATNHTLRQHLPERRGHKNGTIDGPIHQNLFDLGTHNHRLDDMGREQRDRRGHRNRQ